MVIINDLSRRVDIPHEPGEWMELKRLSWRQLVIAADIQTDNTISRFKKVGSDLVKMFPGSGDTEKETKPELQYDKEFVLEAGITRWSYDAEVNKDNIAMLDGETADWAFTEILGLNKPPTDTERKNA